MNFGFAGRLAAIALLSTPVVSWAQTLGDSLARRGLSVELGGPAGASFNYGQSVRKQTFARIGLAKWSFKAWGGERHWKTAVTAGVSRVFDLSRLPGQHGTWVEAGINATGGRHGTAQTDTLMGPLEGRSGPYLGVNGELGIRFQDAGKGFFGRFMCSPTYVIRSSVYHPRPGFVMGAGVSLGFAF